MLVGIISDTHDNLRHLDKAVSIFNQRKIGMLLHCGDWNMPFTLAMYSFLNCPVKGVLGNGDADIQQFLWQKEVKFKDVDAEISSRFLDITLGGKRFAVFHGNMDNLNNLILESGLYDVFCCGHTHKPKIERVNKTLIINPGSLVGVYLPESRQDRVTVALYDTEKDEAEIIDLEI
ncbi:MAG: metallophosphoesterase [Candidatus Gribaldobacteria bacterium]|nr:metallophosphoesterase [Candidatus Gribaldobacteria bacterium]